MVQITKITYMHNDGSVKIERPVMNKLYTMEQMEKFREILIKNNNCRAVYFTYEEC